MELETAPFKPSGQSPSSPETTWQAEALHDNGFPAASRLGQCAQTDATLMELVEGLPNMLDLPREMFPPKWSYLDNI